MKNRLPLALLTALLLSTLPATLLGAEPPARKGKDASSSRPATFREMSWDDLVPEGWDPLRELRATNPGLLDDSPRSMQAMRDVWDRAPTIPALDGEAVKLPGYVVPLEEADGGLKEFLLVPYFGACIHSPPPPANQIVHVVAARPAMGVRTMDVVWVSGTLRSRRHDSGMGVSGYGMEVVSITPYVRPGGKSTRKP